MTDDDIKRLREAAQAATKGPWTLGARDETDNWQLIDARLGGWHEFARVCVHLEDEDRDHPEGVANAAYIAAASPDVVTRLIDRLEAAERERDEAMNRARTWENEAQRRSRRYETDVSALRAERDALAALLRTVATGYTGSVMVGGDCGAVTLHYTTSAQAEAAHAALTDYIDALAAKEQK